MLQIIVEDDKSHCYIVNQVCKQSEVQEAKVNICLWVGCNDNNDLKDTYLVMIRS